MEGNGNATERPSSMLGLAVSLLGVGAAFLAIGLANETGFWVPGAFMLVVGGILLAVSAAQAMGTRDR